MQYYSGYADGACLLNPGPGGWGVRLYLDAGRVEERVGYASDTTNNRMELSAVLAALEWLPPDRPRYIYTDSMYVVDGIGSWMQRWKATRWQTRGGAPVKNQDLWMAIDALLDPKVHVRHVRGHSGDPHNERVDWLAGEAAYGGLVALFCGTVGAKDDPVQGAQPPRPSSCSGRRTHHTPTRQAAKVLRDTPIPVVFAPPRYVSVVGGVAVLHKTWAACQSRINRRPGATCKKVGSSMDLWTFCAQHKVEPPGDAA